MTVKRTIADGDGSGLEAHAHKFSTAKRDDHVGLLTQTDPLLKFKPEEFHAFLNDDFGSAMNQNIAFGGTPEIIHNGGSTTEWTGSVIQGTWNFADSAKITITSADDNDQASFAEETPTTIDMSGFTALTGKVDLDIYNENNNSIIIQFDNAGVAVGNPIDLNDFIDTGDFSEQSFAIPKAELGLTTQLLDGMTLTITRTGGTKPTIKFDDIQFEATGNPAVFKVTIGEDKRFHITQIRVILVDNITGITTVSGATENATVSNLAYNKILGVTKLTNGIIYAGVKNGETVFSGNLKQLADFLVVATIDDHLSDGTNTLLTLVINLIQPIVLFGGADNNFLSLTINDNLSGLVEFRAIARGAVEA